MNSKKENPNTASRVAQSAIAAGSIGAGIFYDMLSELRDDVRRATARSKEIAERADRRKKRPANTSLQPLVP